MKIIKSIEEEWKDFERAVVPQDASDAQRAGMRMSFFAGVAMAMAAEGVLWHPNHPYLAECKAAFKRG